MCHRLQTPESLHDFFLLYKKEKQSSWSCQCSYTSFTFLASGGKWWRFHIEWHFLVWKFTWDLWTTKSFPWSACSLKTGLSIGSGFPCCWRWFLLQKDFPLCHTDFQFLSYINIYRCLLWGTGILLSKS
jgi:hypothetical protein